VIGDGWREQTGMVYGAPVCNIDKRHELRLLKCSCTANVGGRRGNDRPELTASDAPPHRVNGRLSRRPSTLQLAMWIWGLVHGKNRPLKDQMASAVVWSRCL
jgi:hypothetical protein